MIHCVPNCPYVQLYMFMTALKALEEDQLIKTDTDWLAPSAPSDHQTPPAITNDDRMPCIAPAAACLHQMTGAGPHLALSSSSSCAPETRSPVACWPPLHHHWSEQAAQEAGFGDDDPTRGWEGRGDLQQRQCRTDTEPRQHLSGGTIFSSQIPRF